MVDTVSLSYGKEKVQLSLENLNLLDVLKLAEVSPIKDPVSSLKVALANPIGSPPLKEVVKAGDKVAIIVNDDTRIANTSFFLPYILKDIEGEGVEREDICIVFANGTHRLLSEEKQKEILGEEIYKNYRIINHDCHDKENLVYVGETSRGNKVEINRYVVEADKVILTGSIVYHFFVGYGGGRKAVVPGVAAYDTIRFNHSFMLKDGAEIGNLTGNPVHEDILEAVRFVNPDFLLNIVLNDKKEFLGFFTGDYIKAHAEGCRMVDKAYGIPIAERAELVIASCGGHPKDLNLYQAQKTLDNAVRAVSPGGVIILLAKCPEGLGSATLEEWLDKYSTPEEVYEAVRSDFVIGGHKAYALTRLTQEARIIMVTDLPAETVKKVHYTHASNITEAMDLARNFLGKEKPSAYIMPQASLTLPLSDS